MLLGIGDNDPQMEPKFKEFWNDLREIPDDGKIRLDVPEDADEAVENPDYAKDFCLYRLALVHPAVANHENQVEESKHYYVIVDLEQEKQKRYDQYKQRNKAQEYLLKYRDKPKVLNQVLRLTANTFIEDMNEEEREMELNRIVNEYPEDFINVISDKKLENKAYAKELIDLGIIVENGNVGEDNNYTYLDKHLGTSIDKVANFLSQKNQNSEIINKMKSEYEAKKSTEETEETQ